MSNFYKLKKRKTRLPAPPALEQAGNNLDHSDIAPAPDNHQVDLVDRRSLKKTGRTESFATRVTPDFLKKVKQIAARDGLKIVELLEKAVDLYEANQIRAASG